MYCISKGDETWILKLTGKLLLTIVNFLICQKSLEFFVSIVWTYMASVLASFDQQIASPMAGYDIFADLVAGWTSGVVGLIVSHPLDTVKVRLQALQTYDSLFQCISQTLRHESVHGFYKGMAVPLLTAGFLHSSFFLGYSSTLAAVERLKSESKAKRNHSSLEQRYEHPLRMLLLASIAGAVLQWIPSCPIEIVKTKLQVQRETVQRLRSLQKRSTAMPPPPPPPLSLQSEGRLILTGPVDCMRQTLRHVGLRGFYKGGLTMLIRDVIGFCFYLPVYELTLRRLARDTQDKYRQIWAPMLAGGTAGVACWWSILPLDVIKSRLQSDDLTRPKYNGFWHCTIATYRNEGWKAFTRGWHVAALRGFPACACLFLVYEQTLYLLSYVSRKV